MWLIKRTVGYLFLVAFGTLVHFVTLLSAFGEIFRKDSPDMWNMAIGFDQLGNTALRGKPDNMVSARAFYREQNNPRWARTRVLLDAIFYLAVQQREHCKKAFIDEVERKQLPSGMMDLYQRIQLKTAA